MNGVHQRLEDLVMEHDPANPACSQEDIDYIISELEAIQETLNEGLDLIKRDPPVVEARGVRHLLDT
jgi:glycerol-3-phosphate dehydrogenase